MESPTEINHPELSRFLPSMKAGVMWIAVLAAGTFLHASGKSGASFLKIGVGAKAVGMGSAFTAVADDVSAVYWNPAGLSSMEEQELSATHTALMTDVAMGFLGYVHPTARGAIGVSGLYLTQGRLEGRDASRNHTAAFQSSDQAGAISVSREITGSLRTGFTAKFIQQRLAGETAQGAAVDAGVMFKTPVSALQAGFVAQNFGSKMRFIEVPYSLPVTLAGGASYRPVGRMTVAIDVRYRPHEGRTSMSLGTEYSPMSMMSLRAGYLLPILQVAGTDISPNYDGAKRFASQNGLSAGFGFRHHGYALDYAFTPSGELGNAQRFSFSVTF